MGLRSPPGTARSGTAARVKRASPGSAVGAGRVAEATGAGEPGVAAPVVAPPALVTRTPPLQPGSAEATIAATAAVQ
jgi:hypothetical protein